MEIIHFFVDDIDRIQGFLFFPIPGDEKTHNARICADKGPLGALMRAPERLLAEKIDCYGDINVYQGNK